jgi:hypothetical protein
MTASIRHTLQDECDAPLGTHVAIGPDIKGPAPATGRERSKLGEVPKWLGAYQYIDGTDYGRVDTSV